MKSKSQALVAVTMVVLVVAGLYFSGMMAIWRPSFIEAGENTVIRFVADIDTGASTGDTVLLYRTMDTTKGCADLPRELLGTGKFCSSNWLGVCATEFYVTFPTAGDYKLCANVNNFWQNKVITVEAAVACSNECVIGQRFCVGNSFVRCGNYDSDPCYEWNTAEEKCYSGYVCRDGECVIESTADPLPPMEDPPTIPVEVCGDTVCGSNENYQNCPTDCEVVEISAGGAEPNIADVWIISQNGCSSIKANEIPAGTVAYISEAICEKVFAGGTAASDETYQQGFQLTEENMWLVGLGIGVVVIIMIAGIVVAVKKK